MRLVLAIFAALALLAGCGRAPEPLPTDQQLLDLAAARRADLERMAAMMLEDDALNAVGTDMVSPEGAVSDERLAEYRRLLAMAGGRVTAMRLRFEPGAPVRFVIGRTSKGTAQAAKGIEIRARAPAERDRRPSLDGIEEGLGSTAVTAWRVVDERLSLFIDMKQ